MRGSAGGRAGGCLGCARWRTQLAAVLQIGTLAWQLCWLAHAPATRLLPPRSKVGTDMAQLWEARERDRAEQQRAAAAAVAAAPAAEPGSRPASADASFGAAPAASQLSWLAGGRAGGRAGGLRPSATADQRRGAVGLEGGAPAARMFTSPVRPAVKK